MAVDLGHPEKWNPLYLITRDCWFRQWYSIWYKNITVEGKENLRFGVPTILALNHQNTLMDPLVVLAQIPTQITWLARADLYKIKPAVPFLHGIKILPIFRQRDGLKSLSENDAVFQKVVEILEHKKFVGIFPEGTHWGFRRLRQTKKAIPRIVLLAEEKNNFNLDINIVPVGLYYENYQAIRSDLMIKIGEPIPVRQYLELMKMNAQAAENQIKADIEAGLRKNMIDITQTDDLYYMVESLRTICRKTTQATFNFSGNKQSRQLAADMKTVKIIEAEEQRNPDFLTSLKPLVDDYESLLKESSFTDDLIENNGADAFQLMWNCMKTVAMFPLFVIGAILHTPISLLINKSKSFTKDPQFENSLMFATGLVMRSIIHAIYATLWLHFVPFPWWTVFGMFVLLFLLYAIFIDYPRLVKRTFKGIQFNIQQLKGNTVIDKLAENRAKVLNKFKALL